MMVTMLSNMLYILKPPQGTTVIVQKYMSFTSVAKKTKHPYTLYKGVETSP